MSIRGNLKIDRNTAVFCTTRYVANKVLKIASGLGYKWSDGTSYLSKDYFDTFYEDNPVTYDLNRGQCMSYQTALKGGFKLIGGAEFIELHNAKEEDGSPAVVNICDGFDLNN